MGNSAARISCQKRNFDTVFGRANWDLIVKGVHISSTNGGDYKLKYAMLDSVYYFPQLRLISPRYSCIGIPCAVRGYYNL